VSHLNQSDAKKTAQCSNAVKWNKMCEAIMSLKILKKNFPVIFFTV